MDAPALRSDFYYGWSVLSHFAANASRPANASSALMRASPSRAAACPFRALTGPRALSWAQGARVGSIFGVVSAALALVALATASSGAVAPSSLAMQGPAQAQGLAFGFMPYDEEAYVTKDPVSCSGKHTHNTKDPVNCSGTHTHITKDPVSCSGTHTHIHITKDPVSCSGTHTHTHITKDPVSCSGTHTHTHTHYK